MKNLLTLIILIAIGFLIYIYTGVYNIAATVPHSKLTLWIFNTTMERSVKYHAKGIEAPRLDESLVQTGFNHYSEMCEGCHGKPGLSPSEMKTGFYPEPPDLTKGLEKWSPSELFWIIKNGIKMSAMPAFGPTHSEEELWAIVAFLGRLPDLSPEEYQAMEKTAQEKPGGHEHGHGQ
ncbi:MAG: cytochrome c [Candidatus Dadabacteria bacterium]|nr:cytochrome c [Candidatus Dadabacteria bacterium]